MRYFIPTSNSHYFDSLAYIKIDEKGENRYYKNGNVEKLPHPLFVSGNPMLLEVSETEAEARMPKKEPELFYFIPCSTNRNFVMYATHSLLPNDWGTVYCFDGKTGRFGLPWNVQSAIQRNLWIQVTKEEALARIPKKEEPKTRYFIPKPGVSYMQEIAYCSVSPCGTKAANHYVSGRIENCLETQNWDAWFKRYDSTWKETTKEEVMSRLNIPEVAKHVIAELKAKLEQVTKERDKATALLGKVTDIASELAFQIALDSVCKEKCPTLYLYRIN